MPPSEARIPIPEDVDLPEAQAVRSVLSALTDAGREQFFGEMMEAYALAAEMRDGRPIFDVLEAWHRSLLFVSRTGFREAVEESAETLDELPTYSFEEFRKEFGLPTPAHND